ncbi:polyketide cyclase [Chromatiales bacterium (ex Bugula neritina AB1)]|nr:polyketide cyclase [Chromatiales bacterium (ex Bugula neritina AB1)]
MPFAAEKQLVLDHYGALESATPATVSDTLAARTSPQWHWRGMHPFHEQHGAADVAATFWQPFLTSMSRIQRRPDIFFANENSLEGEPGVWVVSMGHIMGLFDQPFLGIPATRKITMLRYAEFNRVLDGRIVETALFCDLIHLMHQAGLQPLPPQTGAHLIQPGPATHDGLLYESQNPAESTKTLELINNMIGDIAANSNTAENQPPRDATPQAELTRCWHDDMLWWGPDGIGATFTIDRYIEQHQRPFRTQLGDRVFNGHIARLTEGNYGGFFGWPNLSLTPLGGYMGLPKGPRADMRVVDIYRRDGDKLAENWIFIDILHFLNMQGLDILGRLQEH